MRDLSLYNITIIYIESPEVPPVYEETLFMSFGI